MIHEIGEIFHRTKQMALDLTKLTASVQAIEATLVALKAEIATLKGNPVTDPADQAAVDAVADKLTADAAAP